MSLNNPPMPTVRLPAMEGPLNNGTSPTPSATPSEARRRSGRVVRAPMKYAPDVANNSSASKRKRGTDNAHNGVLHVENQAPEESESELSDVPSDDVNEHMMADTDIDVSVDDGNSTEEQEPVARASTKSKMKGKTKATSKPPAAKRLKVNGNGAAPSHHALNSRPLKLPARPKKTGKVAMARKDAGGLYADIFTSGHTSDDVAAQWFQRYRRDDAEALTDLVNCVMLASGCDYQLTEDDIRDPDNSANRLTELEEAYGQTNISDYPLITRAKGSRNFRDVLVGFFHSLISLLHQTEVLYTDESLVDNVQRWTGIMSSSALRPFRHTATTVGLAILTSLVSVTKQLDDRITKISQQLQTESTRKGKTKNKGLMENTQKLLDSANENRQSIDYKVKDLFDIVFVHRYRDIDPRIRTECVEALGTWIYTLPTVYMDPSYLRYLGWLLSDVAVNARLEVLKQLSRVLGRDAKSLAHFVDRFRPRLIEMATRDTDVSVRVAAIGVVNVLRDSGMLEPQEIDAVCKLVFDTEPKIRRAAVPFVTELVQEFIDNKTDEIGGIDAIDEVFGHDPDDDDVDSLRRDWINIKSLAENLAVYNAQLDTDQADIRHGLDVAADVVNASAPESRIALAAQALYEDIPQIRKWQILAGYLLYDHSISSNSTQQAQSVEAATKAAVAPTTEEEAILVEVLVTAVRENLVGGSDQHKKRIGKLETDDEDTGMRLATIIPGLLNKFGANPHLTAIIIRLEHYLDLDVFQQLRQNSATYEKVLDEITTQFSRHIDQTVLNEAASAFIHARHYQELEELTDSRLSVLWDNTINLLRNFEKTCDLSVRGNLDATALAELGNCLTKMSKLASVADCVDVLDPPGTAVDLEDAPIKIVTNIVHRGLLTEPDDELDDPEDEVVAAAIKCCQFHLMWETHRLQTRIKADEDIPDAAVDQLVLLRKEFVANLIQTLSSRGFNDDLRLSATGSACDMGALFAFLRPAVEGPLAAKYSKLRPLLDELPPALVSKEIIPIFDAAERAYAKRAKKTLNEPGHDEDRVDDDLPPEDDEDEDLTEEERLAAELKAEKILCELTGKLVLGILAKTVDHSGPNRGKLRKRLMRNKAKLGPSFKEVVSYLEESSLSLLGAERKQKKPAKGKGKVMAAAAAAASKKAAKSAELVMDDDDDSDMNPFEEAEPEEGTEEDLRRRELLDDDDPIVDYEDDGEEEQARRRMDHVSAEADDDDVLGD